jgi:L-aspartate oxidase
MAPSEPYDADFLVIGGGIAGLTFALDAARHGRVALLFKGEPQASNTAWAQGGIAAVWDDEDSVDKHVEDTVAAGAHLAEPELVREILADGPAAVRGLIERGVGFSPGEAGEDYDLTREGGHTERRILHAGDMTGQEIQRALLAAVEQQPNIVRFDQHCAIDLITARKVARHKAKTRLGLRGPDVERVYGPGGPEAWMPGQPDRCLGAYVLDERTGSVRVFTARCTLVATGGAGKIYRYTSNPDLATGDGMAMAWRAGAVVANMEFVQFHPTCLHHPHETSFLISEALRGEGGKLVLPNGARFMPDHDPRAELAPRDIVARAIDGELKRRGLECVYLDMRHLTEAQADHQFPNIHGKLMSLGINMSRDPIPVVPAAHYFCGGVQTDLHGETSVRNLFAIGETACTGLHGANRLASNSLLEAAVFAQAAAARVEARWASLGAPPPLPVWDAASAVDSDELVVITQTWEEIRRFMWNYVGIVRTWRRLKRARRRVGLLREEINTYYWDFKVTRDLLELRNLVTVADLVTQCALRRRESRGLHYTLDFPEADDRFIRDTVVQRWM